MRGLFNRVALHVVQDQRLAILVGQQFEDAMHFLPHLLSIGVLLADLHADFGRLLLVEPPDGRCADMCAGPCTTRRDAASRRVMHSLAMLSPCVPA